MEMDMVKFLLNLDAKVDFIVNWIRKVEEEAKADKPVEKPRAVRPVERVEEGPVQEEEPEEDEEEEEDDVSMVSDEDDVEPVKEIKRRETGPRLSKAAPKGGRWGKA